MHDFSILVSMVSLRGADKSPRSGVIMHFRCFAVAIINIRHFTSHRYTMLLFYDGAVLKENERGVTQTSALPVKERNKLLIKTLFSIEHS